MSGRGTVRWCLNRLSLYVDILEQSLKQLAVSTTLQLCRNVWDRLLTAEENPARSAETALREIVRGIGGDFAALLVTFPHGGRAIAVGEIGRFADLQALAAPNQLAMTRVLETGGTLVVAAGRDEGRASFSSGERDLLETIADMLESLAAAIVRRPAVAGERRSVARPFQQVV